MLTTLIATVALGAPCPILPPHKRHAPHIRVTQSCVMIERALPAAPLEEIATPQVVVRYVILSGSECDTDTFGASYPTYWGAIGGANAPDSPMPRIGGIVPRAPPQPRREPTAPHPTPEIGMNGAGLLLFVGTLLVILGVKRQ
jgi:hypothetical protein